jgi:murein DD-endopeptidase MepM/ murein hydrolase activator NlpD
MGKRIWNVVLVPEGGGAVRNLRIPVRVLYGAAAVLAIGAAVTIGSVGLHFWTLRGLKNITALRQENASLRDHLSSVNSALAQVEAMVRNGEQMGRQARLLAGLDPIDAGTEQTGSGGPLLDGPSEVPGADPKIASTVRDQDQRLDILARKVTSQKVSIEETLQSLRSIGDRLAHTPSICPLRDRYLISSGYGWRVDPFTSQKAFHSGLDLRAESGTPIFAPADGEVVFVGYDGDFGLCVRIRHGYGLETGFYHLSSARVKSGGEVRRGECIGAVGSSGRSTAPHLHYEVFVNGMTKDPSPYILTPRTFAE